MSLTYAQNDWYAVAFTGHMGHGKTRDTMLLGTDLQISGTSEDPTVRDSRGNLLPVQVQYDHVWTTLGDNPRPLFEI
ncbi:MAG: aromatic ring-hydroxylating dioxygenase subunit alpha, partial [Lentilitoribacter sp.]